MRHLITINDLTAEDIQAIFKLADSFYEQLEGRMVKKVPLLSGTTVALLFVEPSTRTRVSFELAARRLSADVVSLAASSTSLKKGESLIDTALTLSQYGIDLLIIRHPLAGAPDQLAVLELFGVINAGDGKRAHPTQALLDAYTVYRELKRIKDLKIAFIGDILHSRVARSNFELFSKFGAKLYAVAPPTLLPEYLPPEVTILSSVDEALEKCDILYFLRIQLERMMEKEAVDLTSYRLFYALTREKLKKLGNSYIMHPGPVNRGIELDSEAIEHPNSLILKQVKYGLYLRMAVLTRVFSKRSGTVELFD
jgi:aspartate carbamoyltransferase catalytic subunit